MRNTRITHATIKVCVCVSVFVFCSNDQQYPVPPPNRPSSDSPPHNHHNSLLSPRAPQLNDSPHRSDRMEYWLKRLTIPSALIAQISTVYIVDPTNSIPCTIVCYSILSVRIYDAALSRCWGRHGAVRARVAVERHVAKL